MWNLNTNSRRRGMALMIVVLTVAALAILATPFILSMRLQERSSRYAVAKTRARYATTAAYTHALSQLLLATQEYGEPAVRFDDLSGEFTWRRGQRGVLLGAEVQDEQGKVNLNIAPERQLAVLFADADLRLGLGQAQAAQLAAAVLFYRTTYGPFPTLDDLAARGTVAGHQLDALRAHITVHSRLAEGGHSAPININSASKSVLRSVFSGVRASYVEPEPDPANAGDGAMSLVELGEATTGVWLVRCTGFEQNAQTEEKTFTFSVVSYHESDPSNLTDHGTFTLTEGLHAPGSAVFSGGGVTFRVFNGSQPFEDGDRFTFSAERFSYEGTAFNPAKVNALLAWFRAGVVSADLAAGTLTLDDASRFSGAGWVRVNGELVRYAARSGNVLQGLDGLTLAPSPGDAVLRLVPDMETFADLLTEAVEAGVMRQADRSALLDNARNAATSDGHAMLTVATSPLVFRSLGRYTVEATGSVNDEAGREVRRMRVRRVVDLQPGDEAALTLNTQFDFDRARSARPSDGLITLPHPTYLRDVAPSREPEQAGLRLAPRVETPSGWGFGGPTLFGATTGRSLSGDPIAAAPDTELIPGVNLYVNGDPGVFVTADDAPVRVFAPASDLNADGSLRRVLLWVKPSDDFNYGANQVFFDTGPEGAATGHINRIRLMYHSTGRLVFRIADEAAEPRSAEIQAPVNETVFARNAWHRVEAVWSGMDIGQMALMLNGRLVGSYSPSGAEARQTATPALSGEAWVARVGNFLEDTTGATRGTQAGTPEPVSVYGYGACRFINQDASNRKAEFNTVHRGGASLSDALGKAWVTAIKIPTPVPPEVKKTQIEAGDLIIPVADATDLPADGYIRIGNEIIKYDSKSTAKTDAAGATYYELTVPADGRGSDFGTENLATRFTSEPAAHNDGSQVIVVSVKVTSNTGYPMPQLMAIPSEVQNYFGLSGLTPNTCGIQVGDEWISYTHRAGTQFLVHVQATADLRVFGGGSSGTTSSMRGDGGTVVAEQASGASVLPVYAVTSGGRLGTGDRVSLLDDTSSAADRVEQAVKRAVSSSVAFSEVLPAGLSLRIARSARLVKFPSGRYRPQRRLSIGGPLEGSGSRAESAIGCLNLFQYNINTGWRLKEAIDGSTAGGFDIPFGSLKSLYDAGDTAEWPWNAPFGVASWPLTSYVNIGGEAFLVKVRYPHNISYSSSLGAISNSASTSVNTDGGIAATGNIVWTRQGDAADPIAAGFNPYGGFMEISSYTRTATAGSTRTLDGCSDELLQWLIANGYVTQDYVDANGTDNGDGTWSFPEITTEGGFSTSQSREYVFYTHITPNTPGADTYTFHCDAAGRHLDDSHKNNEGNPLGHTANDDGEGGLIYPRLTARTVALTVLHRGGAAGTLGLGTAGSAQPQGASLLPMSHLPVTLLTGPPVDPENAAAAAFEGDRLPVESTAGFPESGYLEITNASGAGEILAYTGLAESTIPASDPVRKQYYFTGIRHFRGRFGTTPIDLSGLSVLTDLRDTSAAQISACRTERRTVRLFHPRFPDRMPLQITMSGGAETARDYTPHDRDADLLYFETTRTVRGATWTSLDWEEALPPGTDIVVLARVGDSPDWATAQPVLWSAVNAAGGRVLYKFDTPGAANTMTGAVGDTITVRVYFKFLPGYDRSTWALPTLRSLTLRYQAGPRVLESEVLDY